MTAGARQYEGAGVATCPIHEAMELHKSTLHVGKCILTCIQYTLVEELKETWNHWNPPWFQFNVL